MSVQSSVVQRCAICVYGWLTIFAQPLLRRKLRRRGALENGYLENIPERFGHYVQPAEGHRQLIWIHAVSLGETRAAAVLIKAMRQEMPDLRLLLTHGTATGRAEGRSLLGPGDVQVWQPWDTPQATANFFAHFRPRLGVLMETELWPNLVLGADEGGVPLVLANARMSERSLKKAQRLAWLARPIYGRLKAVLAQTQADAQRLASLGAPVTAVLGNLKFDATPDPLQCQLALERRRKLERPILMFASSREGEESVLLQALAQWPQPWPWTVLVVPRHPQRFEEVAQLILASGHRISRRSSWGQDLGGMPCDGSSILLGDSLAEMALYYSLASAALLGGSFLPLGGQNLIEACACACPVILGPHTFNFAEAAEQALSEGAALRATDLPSALAQAADLVQGKTGRASERAQRFARGHRGAAQATSKHLQAWL